MYLTDEGSMGPEPTLCSIASQTHDQCVQFCLSPFQIIITHNLQQNVLVSVFSIVHKANYLMSVCDTMCFWKCKMTNQADIKL